MRVWAALTLFATAAATARAAECSSSEMDQVLTAEQELYMSSDCATITTDVTTATVADVCESSCMDFLASITGDFPDCEYYGYNLHTMFTELLAQCGMSADEGNAASTVAGGAAFAGVATAATLALLAA